MIGATISSSAVADNGRVLNVANVARYRMHEVTLQETATRTVTTDPPTQSPSLVLRKGNAVGAPGGGHGGRVGVDPHLDNLARLGRKLEDHAAPAAHRSEGLVGTSTGWMSGQEGGVDGPGGEVLAVGHGALSLVLEDSLVANDLSERAR